jgi:hypothetical protein
MEDKNDLETGLIAKTERTLALILGACALMELYHLWEVLW